MRFRTANDLRHHLHTAARRLDRAAIRCTDGKVSRDFFNRRQRLYDTLRTLYNQRAAGQKALDNWATRYGSRYA